MAVHARLRRGNVGDGRPLDRYVTVAAIETELTDVELVAVRNRLHRTIAHVRVPRGQVVPNAREYEDRSEATADGSDERELIPPGREDLAQRLRLRGAHGS
jgi:hypothetical protein